MLRASRVLPFVLAAAASLPLAGCDESAEVATLDHQVTELRTQVKKLETERDRLTARVDNTDRRLAGLQSDFLALQKTTKSAAAVTAAASDAAGAEPGGVVAGARLAGPDGKVPQNADEFSALLETDAGRAAFDSALKQAEQRRDEERQNRMAAGMVDSFSQKANLSPEQTEKMRKIATKAFSEISTLWRSMRDQDLTPEQRQSMQADNMAKMAEIRTTSEDEVKSVLDASQWDLYQQETSRMRGFMGGGFGGAGGGGRGGRGQ